jgi:hypothetical protein
MGDWGLIRIASHKNWSKNERKKDKNSLDRTIKNKN